MSRVTSDVQVDMTQPDFYAFAAGQYKFNYIHDITVAGIVYQDVLEILSVVNGVQYDFLFAGPSIQIQPSSSGTTASIVGGTVTGLLTLVWNGEAYVPATLIDGISISAVAAYEAFTTPTNTDDIAVLKSALQGQDFLLGSAFADTLYGYGASTRFTGGGGDDAIIGTSGLNTAYYEGISSDYILRITAGSLSVSVVDKTGAEGTDSLINVEYVKFADQLLENSWFTKTASLSASQITDLTQLYVASFNRAPDAMGLDYWGSQLKDGWSLQAIAKSFFAQREAAAAYPAGQSTEAFVTQVYNNVLNRGPDSGGLSFWSAELDSGHISKDSFLLAVINGARAAGGTDAQVLTNKGLVGAHFALTQGLSNLGWANLVMTNVNATAASVTAANAQTDALAATAAEGTTELIVQIVGLAA
jgi:hypothetical protein